MTAPQRFDLIVIGAILPGWPQVAVR